MTEVVVIEKLVHGGQGMARLADGRVVFVWNGLPGEKVVAEVYKRKRDYVEAIATEIIEASPERVEPLEPDSYLATSPWQIIDFAAESNYKKAIINETFEREKITLPDFGFVTDGCEYGYRNKMEYSFFGDDNGLHLALHRRGSHRKMIVNGSALAQPEIDQAGNALIKLLNNLNVRATDLKSVIIRCTQDKKVAASLFVKSEIFCDLGSAISFMDGLDVYHSNPKSPASVATKLLQSIGSTTLSDTLQGRKLDYGVNSFFQGNVPVFERALDSIRQHINQGDITDMFCGVGAIGLSIGSRRVSLVEFDPANAAMLHTNAEHSGLDTQVVIAPAEKATEHITAKNTLIVDPPRAGLHAEVVNAINTQLPPQIVYLSCNPSTQARDVGLLSSNYRFTFFEGYNFFPRTPHIETLAILKRIA